MQVQFFRTSSGRQPVREYLDALPAGDRGEATAIIDSIELFGFQTPRVRFRQIRGKLWEFRIEGQTSHRVFYVTITGPVMVLLHAYKKEGQKAPPDEIRTAERRMKEVLHGS